MQELEIESLAGRRFGHLSTGEQRRFLLGRALMHDPPVLVLDEPTSGLDLKACFQHLDILRAQIQKGKTVLLVTHHLHEIPPEVERVLFLKEGRIIADGRKDQHFTDGQLSRLFDRPLTLVLANGWHQALRLDQPPANTTVNVRSASPRRTLTDTRWPGVVRSIR